MNMLADLSDNSLARIAHKRTFTARDGANIFYRYWPVNGDARARGAVVLLHRGHEHGKRLAHLVEESGLGDFAFYAWDMRGHGLSADNPLPDIATANHHGDSVSILYNAIPEPATLTLLAAGLLAGAVFRTRLK